MITVSRKVAFVRRSHGRKTIAEKPRDATDIPLGRVPRISRLMALAIHFDRLIREGKVADLSELARLAHITQPRMTQIMNLNHLAPDIQEALLFLPRDTAGRQQIHEKMLRPFCAEPDWRQQRNMCEHGHILTAPAVPFVQPSAYPAPGPTGSGPCFPAT